jgi:hypothetical protein
LKRIDFNDLTVFLKNPRPEEQFNINSISSFLKLAWKVFLIILLIDLITGVFIAAPLRYFNLFPSLKEFKFTTYTILKVTLVLPIIEELIFRLPLKISKINLIISFSIIIFLVLNKWFISNILISLTCSLILFLWLYVCVRKEFDFLNSLTGYLAYHFREFFYFQTAAFGFLHLTNYILDFRYFYLFPVFALNYMISGFFWGYLRVRFISGIYLCIASHIVVNSIYYLVLSR